MSTRAKVLSLYKSLLRESQLFDSYNYRNYAIRRIRSSFRENKNVSNVEKLNEELAYGLKNLEIIKRQVVIGKIYSTDQLVIEKKDI